jgi:hypothetical protein
MAIESYADESFLSDLEPKARDDSRSKSPEEIEALINKYGGSHLVRALGRFRGSPNAMKALGQIMKRGGDAGTSAVEYLAQGLIHAGAEVRTIAEEQLSGLKDPDLIMHLARMMDNPSLHNGILKVLKKIDHPQARRIIEDADE